MQKTVKYTIFKTRWGYFGLAGAEYGLLRTCLPLANPQRVKSQLLKKSIALNRDLSIEFDKNFFKASQEQIMAYFEGACVNFNEIEVVLDDLSPFTRSVLIACRQIRFGQITTYAELAERIGKIKGGRAVGNALAKNPLPLIIPCHRVIRKDGKIGGFSLPVSASMKVHLLELEAIHLGHQGRN